MPAARFAMAVFGLRPLYFSTPAAVRRMALGICPTGVTMAGDIALSNLSLLYISVTYYTIVKSTVPLWILLFSVLMRIQKLKMQLLLTVVCVGAGIALASAPAPHAGHSGGAKLDGDDFSVHDMQAGAAIVGAAQGWDPRQARGEIADGDARRKLTFAVLRDARASPTSTIFSVVGSGGDVSTEFRYPTSPVPGDLSATYDTPRLLVQLAMLWNVGPDARLSTKEARAVLEQHPPLPEAPAAKGMSVLDAKRKQSSEYLFSEAPLIEERDRLRLHTLSGRLLSNEHRVSGRKLGKQLSKQASSTSREASSRATPGESVQVSETVPPSNVAGSPSSRQESSPTSTSFPPTLALSESSAALAKESTRSSVLASDPLATNETPPSLVKRVQGQTPKPTSASTSSTQLIGGFLVVLAAMCAGFRWACTQLLLSGVPTSASLLNAVDDRGGDIASGNSSGAAGGVSGNLPASSADVSPNGSMAHVSADGCLPPSTSRSCNPSPARGQSQARLLAPSSVDDAKNVTEFDNELRTIHPIVLLYYMSPFGLIALLPVAVCIECCPSLNGMVSHSRWPRKS